MKANLPKTEPEILALWEERNLYAEIRKARKGSPKFILHDGPPYANGDIHIGHALNKILKDVIVKYKTMRGYDAPYLPGWDCHGMPIEHALFEELGKKKQDIDRIHFRQKARAFALKFVDKQRAQFKRLGVFGEWETPYLTLDPTYEARIIRAFKELYLKGYIYRRKKPVYWCPSCETALAEAEVEYEDKNSPSIYVKFPIKQLFKTVDQVRDPKSVVVWTTTPWTLPANLALCFHPEAQYSIVEVVFQGRRERLVIATKREEAFFAKTGLQKGEPLGAFFGKRVTDPDPNNTLQCVHPLFPDRISTGVIDESVNLEEGTGIVHIAPGHGDEDFHIGRRYGLDVFSPVDEKGRFTREVPPWEGQNVSDANPRIIEDLKRRGLLLHQETITHSYPHCWRCKNPILFRATEQWFLDVEKEDFRKRLLAATESVQWIPAYGKSRIQGMLEARPDWCLSRQRYWGTPIPIAYCRRCRKPIETRDFFEAVEDIIGKEGTDAWFKRPITDFLPRAFQCACGANDFEKEQDILDVWFDSGVSYEAVLKTDLEKFSFPASLYLEGSDQHRGWFQVSLIPSVANEGRAPYEQVLTHGFVMDGEGMKMSKSKGNVVSPQEVVEKFGADVLRLWVFSSQYGEDVRISDEILQRTAEAYRKIRNTFKYLLGNLYDFKPEDAIPYDQLPLEVDRWALAELATLIQDVTEAMERYEFHRAYQRIHRFCVVEMSSFYLDLLKDRLYTLTSQSLSRRSAQTVLFHLLNTLSRMLAPILPFTVEEVNQCWRRRDASIHHEAWPRTAPEWVDPSLGKRWELLLSLRDGVMKGIEAFRMEGKCGSSLETQVHLFIKKGGPLEWLEGHRDVLAMLFIVSDVTLEKVSDLTKEAVISVLDGVGIRVDRARGKKCIRCWNWRETVGGDSAHPDLCDRCVQVIHTLK